MGAVLFFTSSVALSLTGFVGLCSPLLSPVQCCCWCKFKLLCCAGVSLTILSGIPFLGVIQAIIHGTDLSNILIFVRFGIALAVNQPLCSLKHSFCYIQFLSFQVIFKLQGLCHIQK